jgi:DNA replicative helicase MCM subunit Mcm2 (Cdc46/Mcm family)
MRFECKNCGEIFYADVKTAEDLEKVRCDVCASLLVRELGPGLPGVGAPPQRAVREEPLPAPPARASASVMPAEKLLAIVRTLAGESAEGAAYEDIIRKFAELVHSEERAKELFDTLKLEGKVMETAYGSGKYKVVGVEEFAL